MRKSGLFHSDGSPFNPERFKGELMEKATKAAEGGIRNKLRFVRCPEHGQAPTITRNVKGWDVRGCCDKLMAMVRQQLH